MAVDGQRFMTKTQHYRKVTKPLLERKRRARMNLYLDELKELIVDTMDADGDNITKLEKADILELTVNYLKTQSKRAAQLAAGHNQQANQSSFLNVEKFRAGYVQAAHEVSKVVASIPGVDLQLGTHLMQRLGCQLNDSDCIATSYAGAKDNVNMRKRSASEHSDVERRYAISTTPTTTRAEPAMPMPIPKAEDVWRPW